MRSAFNTLYPEGAECGTKCHSCCSLKLSKSKAEEENSSQYGMNLDELKSNLKLKRNCSEGINYLLLKLFSIDELVTSSVMGVSTKRPKERTK
uniref:Uncharacterized protein n=1 Tax=Magallana gigas TaxID=29159 RepID=A0A8W8K157_MAGGI